MSTPNHDTELEEILDKLGEDFVDFNISDVKEIWDEDKFATIEVLHTYLYKQTLELIDNSPVVGVIGSNGVRSERIDKAQLRKAAAERWGQE